jgi:hypothetical protein
VLGNQEAQVLQVSKVFEVHWDWKEEKAQLVEMVIEVIEANMLNQVKEANKVLQVN